MAGRWSRGAAQMTPSCLGAPTRGRCVRRPKCPNDPSRVQAVHPAQDQRPAGGRWVGGKKITASLGPQLRLGGLVGQERSCGHVAFARSTVFGRSRGRQLGARVARVYRSRCARCLWSRGPRSRVCPESVGVRWGGSAVGARHCDPAGAPPPRALKRSWTWSSHALSLRTE